MKLKVISTSLYQSVFKWYNHYTMEISYQKNV